MGFDIITLFLFALVIFLLFYSYDGKVKVVDATNPKAAESFTGDYDDFVLADIHINPRVDDPFETDCDEVITPRLPAAASAAMGKRDATWNVVFGDYDVTEKELDWLARTGKSRVSFRDGVFFGRKYMNGSSRTLSEVDDKTLEG